MKQLRKNITRRNLAFLITDILIVSGSFLFFAWIKPATVRFYLPNYAEPFFYFLLVWLLVSLFIGKFNLDSAKKPKDAIVPVLITNFTVLAVVSVLIYSFGAFNYSRLIVFGTILLSTMVEIILAYFYFSYKKPLLIPEFDESKARKPKFYHTDKDFFAKKKEDARFVETREQIKEIIIRENSLDLYDFLTRFVDIGNPKILTLETRTIFNIEQLPANRFSCLINLQRINGIRRINKFFEAVNSKLPYDGLFISSAETYMLRKKRILKKFPPVINHIYYFFDYIFTRVFPKLPITKNIYFFITLGRNRVLSKAETLGRLYSCGFEVVDEQLIDERLYFVVRKSGEPAFDNSPTYGPFIKLHRYGKGGKMIGVYKMRTMHAYSEYLQEYVFQKNALQEGGKFHDDFRVTASGKFMRKFWLDELPMIFNLLKGDMKLVGVRPLSKHYFNLYNEELKEKRLQTKPGLVPPFYVDLPKTLDEIMASELKYLEAYKKNPFVTDIKYFFLAFYKIVFKHARSN